MKGARFLVLFTLYLLLLFGFVRIGKNINATNVAKSCGVVWSGEEVAA